MDNGLVLVTGAPGFVGRATVRRLAADGWRVRALARSSSDVAPLRERGVVVETARGDVTDPPSLASAMQGVASVVHLVAIAREKGGATFDRINRQGTANVAQAARAAGVQRIVHLGAIGAVDNPRYPFLRSKWQGDQAIAGSGVPFTIIQASLLFGEGDEFFPIQASLTKALPFAPVVGDGKTRFQPLAVDDLARCISVALARPDLQGRTVQIGGPEVLTLDQLMDTIKRVLGLRRPKLRVPATMVLPSLWALERLTPHPPATTPQLRMVALDNIAETADAVQRHFGFAPQRLEEGLGYLRKITTRQALATVLGLKAWH